MVGFPERIANRGIDRAASDTIVRYLGAGLTSLGVLPTKETIVLERFFDESGGMQLVGHSPLGARLNRGLGLALRRRFCVTFDCELQAAASDDAILLSSVRSTASRWSGFRGSSRRGRWRTCSGRRC